MVKSYKFIVKTMVFEGLTGCVREQGFHQKFIKNKSKIHPEIDVKSIVIRGRKMDAQNNGKASKMDSERQPKSSNIHKNVSKNRCPKMQSGKALVLPCGSPLGRQSPPMPRGPLGWYINRYLQVYKYIYIYDININIYIYIYNVYKYIYVYINI